MLKVQRAGGKYCVDKKYQLKIFHCKNSNNIGGQRSLNDKSEEHTRSLELLYS